VGEACALSGCGQRWPTLTPNSSTSQKITRQPRLELSYGSAAQLIYWKHTSRLAGLGGCRELGELVIPGTPYVVPYRVRAGEIEVLRVFHAARK
jgi:hypothetical protein